MIPSKGSMEIEKASHIMITETMITITMITSYHHPEPRGMMGDRQGMGLIDKTKTQSHSLDDHQSG